MAVITAVLLPGLDGTGELFAPFVDAAPVGVSTIVADYPTSEASVDILERHAREKITDHWIVIAEYAYTPCVGELLLGRRVAVSRNSNEGGHCATGRARRSGH